VNETVCIRKAYFILGGSIVTIHRSQRLPLILTVLAAALALLWPLAPAQAHAAYKSSIPAANSIVRTAPTQVTITFLQRLSPQGLSIVVYDNQAKVVSIGDAQISPTDPYTASVAMKGDGSDIYRVDWHTVSAEDGDPTLGAFVFGVGNTDKVTPTTTTSSSSGMPAWVAVLTGILGLIIGFIAGYVVLSRRAQAA
jgi:copper transport protein